MPALLIDTGVGGQKSELKADNCSRRTEKQRAELVVQNIPLVQKIAANIKRSQPLIDYEDLVSAGTIGLIKAVDRYDETQALLSTFAYQYIRGAILREVRDKWQPVKIQRSHWERSTALTKLNNLGMSDTEISSELGIKPVELEETRKSLGALNTAPVEEELLSVTNSELLVNCDRQQVSSLFMGLRSKVKEAYGFISRSKHRLNIREIAAKLKISTPRAREYVNELILTDFILKEGDIFLVNPRPNSSPDDRLKKLSGRLKEVFELICRLKQTTTEAIAVEIGISRERAGVYCRRLVGLKLIIRDGFWLQANFEQAVVEGINKKVQQQIEVTNYLAKLEELMKLKSKVVELEKELMKVGGDRSKWVIENLAVKNGRP